MPDYRYLIVGGGMTGDAACRGIRDHDPDGSIGLIGEEPDPPYSRPPLSKALWQGKDEATIWRGTADLGVDLHLGRRAVVRRPCAPGRSTDDRGRDVRLRAAPARHRRPPAAAAGRATRTTASSTSATCPTTGVCASLADGGASFIVLGGGFIGSEVAAAPQRDRQRGDDGVPRGRDRGAGLPGRPGRVGQRALPLPRRRGDPRRARVAGRARRRGLPGPPRERARARGGRGRGGARHRPRDGARRGGRARGLDGIVVDEYGRAGDTGDVYAAGDVARFPSAVLGTDMRVEHEDQANSHGRAVGANMAGADEPYRHLPFFYSDLFELGYEAVGEVDSRLQTVATGASRTARASSPTSTRRARPRGFLLVDTWGKVDAATELIAAARACRPRRRSRA